MVLKRKITFVLYSIMVLCQIVALCGCDSKSEYNKNMDSAEVSAKIKIGFSMDTLLVERWQKDRDIFVARAQELGAEVLVQNANNDGSQQINQVKYLLEQGINILVIIPHDSDTSATLVQLARKKGIKVISYDRLIRNANVDMYISFDNNKVGNLMAEYITKNVPSGNYIILNGAKTDYNSYMFNNGYKKVLQPYIDNGKISIIEEMWAENWRPESAFKCIEGTLHDGKKIDAIIAANDSLAGAAVEALAEKRLAGRVAVVGHDADLDGCQRVVEGTQLMTVYKPIDKIAKAAAEIAVKMINGEKVEVDKSIYDGKFEVPYYVIDPLPVTKRNMVETVVNDGFHRLEEVYRNIPKAQWPAN